MGCARGTSVLTLPPYYHSAICRGCSGFAVVEAIRPAPDCIKVSSIEAVAQRCGKPELLPREAL